MPGGACKPLRDGGAGTLVYFSSCPCPPSHPYSSEFYGTGDGNYYHNCGDAPFVNGVVQGTPMVMSPADSPPLNLPSRANQKANVFNKAFNPANRKFIVLMIAGFLLFLAVLNYD